MSFLIGGFLIQNLEDFFELSYISINELFSTFDYYFIAKTIATKKPTKNDIVS